MVMGKLLKLDAYPFPLNSPCDDGGTTGQFTTNSLYDSTKYWTPGIWQNALLIISVGGKLYNTIAVNNNQNTIFFPSIQFVGVIDTNVTYLVKRNPPAVYRPGAVLTDTQQFVDLGITLTDEVTFPYPQVPYIQPLLAANTQVSIYGPDDLILPMSVPAGTKGTLIEISGSFNQDSSQSIWIDGYLVDLYGIVSGGTPMYEADISPFSTALIDPDAEYPHTLDWKLWNRGLSPMRGTLTVVFLLETVN